MEGEGASLLAGLLTEFFFESVYGLDQGDPEFYDESSEKQKRRVDRIDENRPALLESIRVR